MKSIEDDMRQVLGHALQLGPRARELERDTELLGNLPELDSMAVAAVLTEIEEEFDLIIHDDEVDVEIFETFGNLCDFVARKRMH